MKSALAVPDRRDVAPKRHFMGTHRLVPPEESFARAVRHAPAMGITRIADVTGLDHVGVPVVMVCRPNSRSLSVSQGKGLTMDAARASGLMESIEQYHAERVDLCLRLATYDEMRRRHRVVDVSLLPKQPTSPFHPDLRMLWAEGHDVMSDETVWVPYELVHLDCTLPLPAGSGCFPLSSNGLASGNHVLEALSHGICELIERDATVLWQHSGISQQEKTRVDLGTVDDPACVEVLGKCDAADLSVGVWETSTDVGVPSFYCMMTGRSEERFRVLYSAAGMGTHPTRSIALLRALTEALQGRLTLIAGSRDDCFLSEYEQIQDRDVHRGHRAALHGQPVRSFRQAPSYEQETFAADVQWLVERLSSVGIAQLIAFEFTDPAFDLPLVRVLAPGLKGPDDKDYPPGARARKAMDAAQ